MLFFQYIWILYKIPKQNVLPSFLKFSKIPGSFYDFCLWNLFSQNLDKPNP